QSNAEIDPSTHRTLHGAKSPCVIVTGKDTPASVAIAESKIDARGGRSATRSAKVRTSAVSLTGLRLWSWRLAKKRQCAGDNSEPTRAPSTGVSKRAKVPSTSPALSNRGPDHRSPKRAVSVFNAAASFSSHC